MKNAFKSLSIVLAFLYISSCADRAKRVVVDKDIVTDSATVKQGIPLDNIHRSRPADTLQSKEQNNSGVPLDNLNRREDPK